MSGQDMLARCNFSPRNSTRDWAPDTSPNQTRGHFRAAAAGRRDVPVGPARAGNDQLMTTLLQRAVAEVEKLPVEDQDAIASRLLAEVEDEREWAARFASTTDAQWDLIVAEVRREVATGGTFLLDEAFPPDEDPR